MYKIEFSKRVIESIRLYADNYLRYYEELYADSGIWSQERIIKGYNQESFQRYTEIIDTIEDILSNEIISYSNNEALIRWRSKILLVSFTDSGDTRTITDLEIR